jgi:hypothetical protein
MKNMLAVILGGVIVLVLLVPAAAGQTNPGDVWVPEKSLPDGTVIPGYWRPPFQKGFYWVEGKEDGDGNWIPGHWRPVPGSQPRDRAWVPGYWDGTVWMDGYWRPHTRPGYIWVDPRWVNGGWETGHWRAYEGGQPWRTRYPKR